MTAPLGEETAAMPTVDVLAAYTAHLAALDAGREVRGHDEVLAEHALDALEAAQAVMGDLGMSRWRIVAEALTRGATLVDVAARLALPVGFVDRALQGWADLAFACDEISERERRRIRRLVIGGVL